MRLNIHMLCLVCHAFPVVFGAMVACLPFFPALKKMGRLRSSVSALIPRQACSSHCFEPVTFSNLTRTQAVYFTMCPASPARAFNTAVSVFLLTGVIIFLQCFYLFLNPFRIWSRSPRSESSSVGALQRHCCCCCRCCVHGPSLLLPNAAACVSL